MCRTKEHEFFTGHAATIGSRWTAWECRKAVLLSHFAASAKTMVGFGTTSRVYEGLRPAATGNAQSLAPSSDRFARPETTATPFAPTSLITARNRPPMSPLSSPMSYCQETIRKLNLPRYMHDEVNITFDFRYLAVDSHSRLIHGLLHTTRQNVSYKNYLRRPSNNHGTQMGRAVTCRRLYGYSCCIC